MRLLEKLKDIVKLNDKTLNFYISNYLLIEAEKGNFYKSKEIASKLSISKSTLTLFSKKLGYEGYSDLLHNLTNEYNFFGLNNNSINEEENKKINEIIVINKLFNLYELNKKLDYFVESIKNSNKVMIVSTEENDFKQLNLFSNFLNTINTCYFFENRKYESFFVNNFDKDSLVFFILTGLDISEILLLMKKVNLRNIKSIYLTSDSHISKLDKFNIDSKNIISVKTLIGYTKETRCFIRIGQINLILTNLIFKLTKQVHNF
ncbi:hypothetical protein [Spiroplasma turonicum]|uniref:HTH rpiR-type domain-containing protein n=1 Tax=Spiroplasma turonicum TaxID=216946 RepID=A0A0K1P6D1_9MOLU|nr:hypothetical protein [Spiroplasma turonicum]AKU79840.1 hypothetical protein STURON_00594 [Spiroplasma turonicum]ALX70856.1 hypothetical protein STURO_v1c05900 [Spiroplasma turonicum]